MCLVLVRMSPKPKALKSRGMRQQAYQRLLWRVGYIFMQMYLYDVQNVQ